MRFNFFFNILIVFIFASSCVTSNISTKHEVKEKELYANTGFALIYNDQLFSNKWQPTIKLKTLFVDIFTNIISQSEIVLLDTYLPDEAQKEYNIISKNLIN